MRLLLDTHAYLWWLDDDPSLSVRARAAIADPDSIVRMSAVSIWEASIKAAAGRLELGPADLLGALEANAFIELPVRAHHAIHASTLPRHHGDPFDRLLVAQAEIESLAIITSDRAIAAYGVALLN